MPYKCSKCGKEFQLKCRFRGHMRKRLPCVTQTSLDAFKRLATIVLRKFQNGCRDLDYLENRVSDIHLFYNNLSDEEKNSANQIYNEDLTPVFDLFDSIEYEQHKDTADSGRPPQ
jgi:hypothetical protein